MIGKRIRTLREKASVTQKELAAKVGVSRVYIVQLETGVMDNPTLKVLRALAKALRVDVADLIR